MNHIDSLLVAEAVIIINGLVLNALTHDYLCIS